MLKAIIIDDEQHCSDRLCQLLSPFAKTIEIIDTFADVETGYSGICKHEPDVVFLDIQIHDRTGFSLLEKFEKINFDVIFTTAYEDFAIKAIKFSAFDYLLKPIDPDDLATTIHRLMGKESKSITPEYQALLQNILNLKSQNKKIAIHTQTEMLLVNIQDIIRCQSDINYTTLFFRDKKPVLVSKTLKDFEMLLSPYNFCRVHNSHLINLEYMKSYDKGKGGYVHLTDNTSVEVSVRRKEELLDRISRL